MFRGIEVSGCIQRGQVSAASQESGDLSGVITDTRDAARGGCVPAKEPCGLERKADRGARMAEHRPWGNHSAWGASKGSQPGPEAPGPYYEG